MALSMNMQQGPHSQLLVSKHTHTFADMFWHICTQIHKHMAYVHTLACTYGHTYVRKHTHTQPDYFAYLLSKQSLLGSPLLTPALHQSIKPALWDPVKPRYLWSDLKLVSVLLLLTGSHSARDCRFKINAACRKRRLSGF